MKFPALKDYPRKILVREAHYTVKFVREFKGHPTLLGLHDSGSNTITIKIQPLPEMYDTFMHELIHAFEAQYKFQLNHRHVYKLSEAICQYLKDNAKPLRSRLKPRPTKKRRK